MTTTVSDIRPLQCLPRVGFRSGAGDIGALLRPGAANSPLSRLGERLFVDMPMFPPVLVTRSAADVRAVLTDRDDEYSFGQLLRRMTAHDVLFGADEFIFLEGEEHLAERKRLFPPFNGRALRSYEDDIVGVAASQIEDWPVESPVSFLQIGSDLALGVMISIIFGVTEPSRTARLRHALHGWFGAMESTAFIGLSALGLLTGGHALPYPPLRRWEKAIDRVLLEEIAARRAGDNSSDGGMIMHFIHVDDTAEKPKGDLGISRRLRNMVLAGYETTAVTLAWIAEFVSHSPAVLDELHRTVDAGDDAYLDAVITEALRLRPAVPVVGRRARRATVFNGLQLPKGALVMVPILAVHEDPTFYEDPESFRPERFLAARPSTYLWLPFGGGAHRCLGANLSLFEARILLKTILKERTFAALPGPVSPPRRRHPMLVPENGASVVLQRR
ncbi:cytochrome P450 [Mycobacterium sp. 1274756.6]|uniref:cytochrome P450 n=1 Tax=Mycobacterium sp. 1274756.6 TaxID=1834076 RepID=UPI0007FEC99D|nr:cytochrome P450 [Mycobacterium sp. 1274756.6]OBJ70564.1 hypothetical protein A5643_09195 [Mycobacterium sp. 1274756.6]